MNDFCCSCNSGLVRTYTYQRVHIREFSAKNYSQNGAGIFISMEQSQCVFQEKNQSLVSKCDKEDYYDMMMPGTCKPQLGKPSQPWYTLSARLVGQQVIICISHMNLARLGNAAKMPSGSHVSLLEERLLLARAND
jgi:hypothetical protein